MLGLVPEVVDKHAALASRFERDAGQCVEQLAVARFGEPLAQIAQVAPPVATGVGVAPAVDRGADEQEAVGADLAQVFEEPFGQMGLRCGEPAEERAWSFLPTNQARSVASPSRTSSPCRPRCDDGVQRVPAVRCRATLPPLAELPCRHPARPSFRSLA